MRTREIHALLDDSMGGIGSLGEYRAYLSMVLRFRRAAEPTVLAASPHDTRFRPTSILQELEQDCRELGFRPPASGACHSAPAGPDEWFGAAYVLEGSGFGARVLAGQAARLDLGPLHGARHLHRLASASGNWTRFVSELEERQGMDLDRAAAEANRLFALALDYVESRELAGQC